MYGITSSFFMYLATPTLINAWFRKSAGLALGIAGAVLSITAAIVSPIGQSMITSHGWQYSRTVLAVIVTIFSVLITALLVRKDPESMGMLPYGADSEPEATSTQQSAVEEGATFTQARGSAALYLVILVAGIFCLGASFFQQIPSFAATGKLGAEAGAIAVSIVMVGGVVGKFLLGWMTDHFGASITGVFASLCGVAGVLLAFISGSNVGLFYVGVGIFGIAFAALTVVSPMLARQGFGTAHYPEIYSWVSSGIFVFSGIAPLLYARIYDATQSFTMAFVFVIVIYVIAAALSPIIVKLARKSWAPRGAQ